MENVLAIFFYLIIRIRRSLAGFFRNWYAGGIRFFMSVFIFSIQRVDRVFALKITVRNFFTPLYNDRTVIGYVLGIILRSGRIVVSLPIYGIAGAGVVLAMIVWMGIPVAIVYKFVTALL
jgi:hypothetical protein